MYSRLHCLHPDSGAILPAPKPAAADTYAPYDLGHRSKFAQSVTLSRPLACHHLTPWVLQRDVGCWSVTAARLHPIVVTHLHVSLGRAPRLHHLCKCALSGCEATLLARRLAGSSMQSWISRRQALRRRCEPTTVAVRKLPHQQQQTREDRLSPGYCCCRDSSCHVLGCHVSADSQPRWRQGQPVYRPTLSLSPGFDMQPSPYSGPRLSSAAESLLCARTTHPCKAKLTTA
jgi:hypothetical protein